VFRHSQQTLHCGLIKASTLADIKSWIGSIQFKIGSTTRTVSTPSLSTSIVVQML